MTVIPPPGWTIASAAMALAFGLLATIVVSKTPKGHDRHYAYFFASLMTGIAGGQLGVLIAYSIMYDPNKVYTYVGNHGWIGAYLVGEWALIIMAFVTTMSRLDKFPSAWPRLEFALQGFASLYMVALTCNQLAAIAPKGQKQGVLDFGEFLFAMTTIVLILTASAYLSMWADRHLLGKKPATADNKEQSDDEKSAPVDMVKQLGDEDV